MNPLSDALTAAQRRALAGVCSRCSFDLTGEDAERDEREARERLTEDAE